jgi:hypothetical protein
VLWRSPVSKSGEAYNPAFPNWDRIASIGPQGRTMPQYSIKHEPVSGPVKKTGKTPGYWRWVVREDGKRIGEFETEQQAMEFRNKEEAISDADDSRSQKD